jgi:hypothetical protein
MNDEMKKFSGDIEERMDKLYKNVKAKKGLENKEEKLDA